MAFHHTRESRLSFADFIYIYVFNFSHWFYLVTVSPLSSRFELAYTHTMYYLAQVYKNLGKSDD